MGFVVETTKPFFYFSPQWLNMLKINSLNNFNCTCSNFK